MTISIRLSTVLVTCLVLCVPGRVNAETSQSLMISEIQTGSSASANDEFIEIYNQSSQTIDLSTYKIEYFASNATGFLAPFRTVVLSGSLAPNSNYLLTSTEYLNDSADLHFAKFMAATGGNIRLVQGSDQIDLVAWGTGLLPENVKAPAPGDGKSLSRKTALNGLQDTDNNAADFEVLTSPTPNSGEYVAEEPLPEPPAETPPPTEPIVDDPSPVDNPPAEDVVLDLPVVPAPQNVLPIQITELLPNPASPATDDSDEFVEVYNPNEQSVDLSGYVIKTGANLSYQQPLSGVIEPKSFAVFYSRDTDLVLSNTTGKAVLYDNSGFSISSTDVYSDAPEGQSWALINGVWQWTTSPTPQSANVLIIPVAKVSSVPGTAKPKSTKKAAAAKVAGSKTATAKKASAPKASKTKAATTNNPAAIMEKPPLHPVILGVVGFLALLYGLYEYRADIRNQILKFRRNRSSS